MTRCVDVIGTAFPFIAVSLLLAIPRGSVAEITRFKDPHPDGKTIEYWRLTHEPGMRDYANYHNTQCFSFDGRYVCYKRLAEPAEVHVVDLHS